MDIFSSMFTYVKQMAVSVTFIIPIVLMARFFLGRSSKRICYLLWGIVAVRLLCPVLLPSDFSLFRFVELPQNRSWMHIPTQQLGERQFPENPDAVLWESGNEDVSYLSDEKMTITGEVSETPIQVEWRAYVWLAGVLGMLFYAAVSCLLLKRRLKFATKRAEQVYECENVNSPFIFGIRKPLIYLPYHLSQKELDYILRHEEYHIRRKDYLIKWFAYFLLTVYWFHPLVWAAYILMNRDMEMSCDEYVLRDCTETERKEYGTLLLQFASGKNGRMISTLAFGEKSIKQRISHVLHYKKRNVLASAAAVLFLIVLAAVCLTDARTPSPENETQGENTTETAGKSAENISQAAIDLYEAANPYIGDVSADGELMGVIAEHLGGFGTGAITELQTDEEPYSLILHFSEEPDANAMWRNAVLLLALIENCGEVDWDYVSQDEKMNFYVPVEDVNDILGMEDIKEYGTSAEKVEELLGLLERTDNTFWRVGKRSDDTVANPQNTSRDKTEIIGDMLQSLPDDPTLSSANILIIGSEVIHFEFWESFCKKVSMGEPADMILAAMTTEGDAIYSYVSYDGENFYVVQDNSRDAFRGDGEIYTEHIYSNLLVEDYQWEDGTVSRIAVLDNDASLTYQDIRASLSDGTDASSVDAWLLFSVDSDMLEKE